MNIRSQPELIVALDVPELDRACELADRLPDEVTWCKVGLELFGADGPAAVRALKERGRKVFLDLKLHDIPRTVGRAVRSLAATGADMMTLHAGGGRAMCAQAAEAAASCDRPPLLLGVTVLTSLNREDLGELGVDRTVDEQAGSLGDLAIEAGLDGLVCSVWEAAALRARHPAARLVTPGIRLPDQETGDQKRIATPALAAREGASHIVVGRPIVQAEDPAAAAQTILNELRNPPA
ncbi:orotidine-5'-phosphate decarboxylase [Kiritimatiella glycovorans]|nr:orotidine-5'-phosphate decarboxylase [Kiritimatiella glycovorans]